MSNRVFILVIALIVIGFGGAFILKPKSKHNNALLVGVTTHKSQGANHIAAGTAHVAYNSDIPSSGPHYQAAYSPAQWGVYSQELPPEIFIHNEEHGGVVIAYKPDLPIATIKKLQRLFAPPSSDKSFSPGKFILIPRSENKYPIELASWTRTYNLQSYDQNKIEQFYLQNVNSRRAPESFGGPTNTPINQSPTT